MEGNECYKFSTIQRYIARTGASPVRLAIDVGANVGAVTRLLKAYFPSARVYAFEAVREYFEVARARTADLADVHVYHRVITSQHLYHDDFGREPRLRLEPLHILKAKPEAGPGWRGGSLVVPADKARDLHASRRYESYPSLARVYTLDQVIRITLRIQKAAEVDVLKMDCEGCEHSCLGSASESSLQSVRYIVGEYHGIQRFFRVMQERLFHTHKVSLIGDRK